MQPKYVQHGFFRGSKRSAKMAKKNYPPLPFSSPALPVPLLFPISNIRHIYQFSLFNNMTFFFLWFSMRTQKWLTTSSNEVVQGILLCSWWSPSWPLSMFSINKEHSTRPGVMGVLAVRALTFHHSPAQNVVSFHSLNFSNLFHCYKVSLLVSNNFVLKYTFWAARTSLAFIVCQGLALTNLVWWSFTDMTSAWGLEHLHTQFSIRSISTTPWKTSI